MPLRPKKFPACEPCRSAKLACDHARPTCLRCRNHGRERDCVYRQLPFKKRNPLAPALDLPTEEDSLQTSVGSRQPSPTAIDVAANINQYPNPGYLGPSSHTTLFQSLPVPESVRHDGLTQLTPLDHTQPRALLMEASIAQGKKLIDKLALVFSRSWISLVADWLAKGMNLSLAESFTKPCLDTIASMFLDNVQDLSDPDKISESLTDNTMRPLPIWLGSTIDDFSASFCDKSPRWETLGIGCIAISRALNDLRSMKSFSASDPEPAGLKRQCMLLADMCLDLALSFDCLNDLQLILQYETFILHSIVDGDQSYQSWRRFGDVISSLFALGYHQQIHHSTLIPKFLDRIRRTTLGLALASDKDISIFLGRPPRINRNYCHFVIFGTSFTGKGLPAIEAQACEDYQSPFDYTLDADWSGLCAVLKEEILDLFEGGDKVEQARKASAIDSVAKQYWSALPDRFKLMGNLNHCPQPPVVRDFMVNAKLNHMHVFFLLRLAQVRRAPQSDPELVRISSDMLNLVAEAITQKSALVNSGTTLVWKITSYGLSAAGVICLWLLHSASGPQTSEISVAKVVRNLSVLVAELETGTLIQADDPNFKLLASASSTISCLLDRLLNSTITTQTRVWDEAGQEEWSVENVDEAGWNTLESHVLQDFEADFWIHLAEHPYMNGPQNQNI